MSELPDPTKLRTKPVFDVGNYGHDVTFPLVLSQATNLSTLTPSTASYHQTTHDSAIPIDELARFISNVDKCELLHAGNDTNFDQTFLISPDMSFWSYKIALTFGIGLKVSAYTNGVINVNNIHLTITEIGEGTGDKQIADLTVSAGSANLTGTGEQITMFHADIIQPIKFTKSRPIKVRIQTEASKSGTATFQVGMLPVFPVLPTAVPKHWIESQIEIHAHASLDHPFPIFRDQDVQEKLDYSGCGSEGCS